MKKKEFKNLPDTDTPINAENLNEMQDNIEESAVIVSATEPTTNEKVWIQKGKNLFNKNNIIVGMSISSTDGTLSSSTTHYFCGYISVMPNTIYSRSDVGTYGVVFLDKNKNYLSSFTGASLTQPFTTPDNCYYVGFNMSIDKYNDGSYKTFFVVQGSSGEYEEYIEPKIHVKNDNGVYEEVANDIYKTSTPSKVISKTDSTYNIRVKAYKNNNAVHVNLYSTNLNSIAAGGVYVTLATLPEGARPMEQIVQMATTSLGKRFTIVIEPTGWIGIGYVYDEVSSSDQIAENITFVI